MSKTIIFVCLGNICRSPLAEGIAKRYCEEQAYDFEISSAGTGTWHIGNPPCENSIKVAHQNGIDISMQRGVNFDESFVNKYDYVVGLDDSNVMNIKKLGQEKVYKLGDFGFEGKDVPDPYFFDGFEGFDKVFDMIDVCVKNLLNDIKNNKI
ncbi:MAG: low molecular weight protein-tyrosine-phosphatase [Sulfurovum sp.]|jgi:protein-tyrosine phosphatase